MLSAFVVHGGRDEARQGFAATKQDALPRQAQIPRSRLTRVYLTAELSSAGELAGAAGAAAAQPRCGLGRDGSWAGGAGAQRPREAALWRHCRQQKPGSAHPGAGAPAGADAAPAWPAATSAARGDVCTAPPSTARRKSRSRELSWSGGAELAAWSLLLPLGRCCEPARSRLAAPSLRWGPNMLQASGAVFWTAQCGGRRQIYASRTAGSLLQPVHCAEELGCRAGLPSNWEPSCSPPSPLSFSAAQSRIPALE